jgi:hypothetical protein
MSGSRCQTSSVGVNNNSKIGGDISYNRQHADSSVSGNCFSAP